MHVPDSKDEFSVCKIILPGVMTIWAELQLPDSIEENISLVSG